MADDKADANLKRLQAVDSAHLTPMVRKLLGSPAVTLGSWNYQPVTGGVGAGLFGTAIYRFSGQGDDQGSLVSWSLMVKVLFAREDDKPDSPKYWKREAELYRSGLLDDLPGDFSAPRSFGVEEFPEACWIWMEELRDTIGAAWPNEHYRTVARHLGQFNGAYLVNRPLPLQPWLSAEWFRKIAADITPNVPNTLNAFSSPFFKGLLPGDAADQYSRLWSERDLFLNTLDRLPQTFCHLDVFRRNLIAQRSADSAFKTAAIDWALTGNAPLGAEIALPVLVGLMMSDVDRHYTRELDTMLFEGYLEGLGDAGWRGDPQIVRLGCTTAAVTKYFEVGSVAALLVDEANFETVEQISGHSMEDNRKQAAEMFRFAFRMADESRDLMKRLKVND